MKIYTKTGDHFTTSLIGGRRIVKSDLQLDVYGTIDELNSFIGLLKTEIQDDDILCFLDFLQKKMFDLGTLFAFDFSSSNEIPATISQDDVLALEKAIDNISLNLPSLKSFILPAGIKSAALAHVCRTISRRVERLMVSFNTEFPFSDNIPFVFMNRLSDYFFVLARIENLTANKDEILV